MVARSITGRGIGASSGTLKGGRESAGKLGEGVRGTIQGAESLTGTVVVGEGGTRGGV